MSKQTAPFRFGTEYYRAPAPVQAFWEEDIAAIADAGFDMIRTFSYWNWIEPEQGVYQLDDFDLFFELAEKNGLQVVFDFTLATHGACPEWMLRKYPDIRLVDNEGRVAERSAGSAMPQGSMIHCYDHPKWEEHGRQYIEAIVNRYKDAPSLGVWSVWDGINPQQCYCDHSIATYRAWLRERFTLDELNERLYRRYRTWEDVQPARSDDAIVEMLLFKQFQHENLLEKLRWQVELITQLDGEHEIHAHGGHYPQSWAEVCAQEVDSWGFSCRSNNFFTSDDPYRFADQFYSARLARSMGKDGRWWYDEVYSNMYPKTWNYEKSTQPEELATILWMTVAEGGEVAQFWQYSPEYMGFEAPGLSLVGLNRLPTARLTAVTKTIKEVKSISEHLPLVVPKAEVAIVYHKWSAELAGLQEGGAASYKEGISSLHRALWEYNIPADVISAGMDWEPYKVICLPNALLLDQQLIEKITYMMKNSPHTNFLADGLLGLNAADGVFSYDPPEGLSDLLGVKALDYSRLTERDIRIGHNLLSTDLGDFAMTQPCNYATLQPLGNTKPFATWGNEIVGIQTEDQRFTWITFGLATALARETPADVGTWSPFAGVARPPGDALYDLLIPFVLSRGVRRLVETSGDRVITRCCQSAMDGWLIFIFNVEETEATVELTPAFEVSSAAELLSGTELRLEDQSFTATVEPRSVSVVYCSPPGAAS